jgi:hypothetical protein
MTLATGWVSKTENRTTAPVLKIIPFILEDTTTVVIQIGVGIGQVTGMGVMCQVKDIQVQDMEGIKDMPVEGHNTQIKVQEHLVRTNGMHTAEVKAVTTAKHKVILLTMTTAFTLTRGIKILAHITGEQMDIILRLIRQVKVTMGNMTILTDADSCQEGPITRMTAITMQGMHLIPKIIQRPHICHTQEILQVDISSITGFLTNRRQSNSTGSE